ncbi:MAG: hypothetical protein JKY50_18840 [Oleispira sp.]|nr:hypothetical protein [Oleispira sp.]
MFDDYHWQPECTEAQEDKFQQWKGGLATSIIGSKQKLVVIESGAGTEIPSVRCLTESMDTDIIRINPRESLISIPVGGLEALLEIDKLISYSGAESC